MDNPMVSVVVVTYNQERWIRQTLDSILSQKTTYSFEVIVGEDMGKDGTRKICEEYAKNYENVQMASQDHNLGVTANWLNCISHSSGKYIMNCAGDDYWHNPNKIQLQVDYMEMHPDCVICHTDRNVLFVKTGAIVRNYNKSKSIIPPEGRIQRDILRGKDCISAVTQCIRKDMFDKYIPVDKYIELAFPREDWPTEIILSAHGNVNYIPISTATYRQGQPSISNEISYEKIIERYKRDCVMTEYLYSLFPEWGTMDEGTRNFFENQVYHSLLLAAYENNDYKSAREFAQKDSQKGWPAKMTKNICFFQLWRFVRLVKK